MSSRSVRRPFADRHDALLVLDRRAEAEDAAHADATISTSLRLTRLLVAAETQTIQVIVAAGIFFDVDVALRDVRFGLVVVVIADEIPDRVVAETSP